MTGSMGERMPKIVLRPGFMGHHAENMTSSTESGSQPPPGAVPNVGDCIVMTTGNMWLLIGGAQATLCPVTLLHPLG
jgi:hypothetical protein